ncbi:hypothetical protein FRC01_006105, partial [Tulasnella sp. 417]
HPRSGRNSALDDAEVRAREREEIERRVRAEAEKERQRLEAEFAEKERELAEKERLRQKEIAMEKEREAAKQRERQLEAELEAQRDLNRQREREVEEERERIRQRETEEILNKAREEMEARISRAVEEEVKRRMDELQVQREAEAAAAAAAASAAATPKDASFGSSSAHDMDEEVKKRLDALEAQYALQRADAKELENMSSKARKDMASAFLNVARQYHDKQDWQTALVFYRRCQSFVPDNAKLRARIQEVEIAIEKEKQGVAFSPVKQSGKGSKRQPSPALVPGFGKEAQNMDLDDPVSNDFEFDFQQLRQTRQGKATKSQKKRSRGEAAPAPPTIEEESSDIEIPQRGRGAWVTPSQLAAGPFPLQTPSTSYQPRLNTPGSNDQAPSGSTFISAPTSFPTHTRPSQHIDTGVPVVTISPPAFFVPGQAGTNANIPQAEPVTQATNLAFTSQVTAGSIMPPPQLQVAARPDSNLLAPIFRRIALSQIQAQNTAIDSMRSSSLPPRESEPIPSTKPHRSRSLEQRALRTIQLQQAYGPWNERGTPGCPGDCQDAHICKKCFEWLGETGQRPARVRNNGPVFDKAGGPQNTPKTVRRESSPLASQMDVDTPLDGSQPSGLEQASNNKSAAEDKPCVEWNLGLPHSKNCRALHVCRECFNLRKTLAEHMEKNCFYYHRRIQGMDVN